MELSASAPEFRPEVVVVDYDHDFPSLGSDKPVEFREDSLNPALRKKLDSRRKEFQEENEKLASNLVESQGGITQLGDRNSWLEWSKKRLIDVQASKIVDLEGTIRDHKERDAEVESDLKYYRERLEKADSDLRVVRDQSNQKSHEIADVRMELRRVETELRIRTTALDLAAIENRERESSSEQWIGCALKLKFIFGEVEKIGALPEDHAEWVMAMVDSIEIPSVSARVRNKFLPSYEDAHMDDVDSDDETDRIREWSHEAAIFSDQLGEHVSEQLGQNQSSVIKSFITIQKFVRGFIVRRRHQYLYGGNPVERTMAATLIQKIYRGFRGRGFRFYKTASMFALWKTARFNNPQSDRRDVRFINSGTRPFMFAWVKPDGSFKNPQLIVGNTLGWGISMTSFVSHWFAIYPVEPLSPQTSGVRYIRVNYAFTGNSFFDVHTGVSLPESLWMRRTQNQPSASLGGCNCENCQRRHNIINSFSLENGRVTNQLDDDSDDSDDSDDESRLQLAIHLSLDTAGMVHDRDTAYNLLRIVNLPSGEMITDDAPDYDIAVMFN